MDWLKMVNWEYVISGLALVMVLAILILVKKWLKLLIISALVFGVLYFAVVCYMPGIASIARVRIAGLRNSSVIKKVQSLPIKETLGKTEIMEKIEGKVKKVAVDYKKESTGGDINAIASCYRAASSRYAEVVRDSSVDTSVLQRQLDGNKNRERAILDQLKSKELLLASLDESVSAKYQRLKTALKGKQEIQFQKQADSLNRAYNRIKQDTNTEIASLKKDLSIIRERIAELKKDIELRQIKNQLAEVKI